MTTQRGVLYGLYERRLLRELADRPRPHHVGVMLDGNRRWAREMGLSPSAGHRRGAAKINDLLTWCVEAGVGVVTLYLLSTDNLGREEDELAELISIIEDAVTAIAHHGHWKVHPIGALDLLPEGTSAMLRELGAATKDATGLHVNVAIGYGGRREITDAVKSLIKQRAQEGVAINDLAESIDVDNIGQHLYTKGQPDPDLVIRTSGEQRLSGFLLWQSANSEFYFCEAYWPDFRRVDFLRALRAYAERERRFGA